ncbi:hypothetical protein JTE90_022677 [Oedothorax gibbosus]|uniref:Transforming growth factor-beta-induced protein ig-h3 n=1 Tax=Oedothorax gibbosus TaxID=931172 RepID=A0AAV6ULN3_9ARAC|nr:hypothetical protein JTE90_022677 [Oedothorax gibbosus]
MWNILVVTSILVFTNIEAKRIPNWHLKIAQSQGPNTCAVEEVPGTNKKYWTDCKYWMNREICGSKTVLRYECCEGFHQLPRNGGCFGVKPMTDVVRTAKDLGATLFVEYLNEAGLTERLRRPGEAITLFAPTNEAFEHMTAADQESLRVSLLEPESPYLLYHAVAGRKLHSRDFKGEQEAETLHQGTRIRVNKYNHGMTTVNCAPMVRKDQQATNGIVHLIDQVLIPPSTNVRPTIPETLFQDGRFREMSRAMLTSNYVNELRRGGPFTLLAPTDEAFQSIGQSELQSITADPEARLALMKHHIIPHTVCLPAVIDSHKMTAADGHRLQLSCNGSGVYVDDARVLPEQLIAQNGVISVISKVLIPDRSRSVMSLLSRRPEQVSTFSRLLKKSGVGEAYLNKPNITVTVFAPSNHAFNQMPEEEFSQLDQDQGKLEELMKHHVVIGRVKTDTISDDQKVDSVDGQNALRLKVYRNEVGVESAIIEDSDIEGQNGVVHIINRVLTPPSGSIMELLQSKEEYSMMADAIHHVQKFEPQFLVSRSNRSFTMFAPTNQAFEESLGEGNFHNIMKNKRKLKKMVQNHVVDNMFSAGSIHTKLQYNVRTEYQTVNVHKEKDGLMVNSAHVIMPDVVTKDGIVHCIDKVLVPERKKRKH